MSPHCFTNAGSKLCASAVPMGMAVQYWVLISQPAFGLPLPPIRLITSFIGPDSISVIESGIEESYIW